MEAIYLEGRSKSLSDDVCFSFLDTFLTLTSLLRIMRSCWNRGKYRRLEVLKVTGLLGVLQAAPGYTD